MDSDFTVVYHDYQAADSDLRVDMDSDGIAIRHDFRAADSDLRIDMDSDFAVVYHDYKAADSDLITEVQKILDSDLPNIIHNYLAEDSDQTLDRLVNVVTDDSDLGIYRKHDSVLAWDSDKNAWTARDALSASSYLMTQQFTATDGQTEFILIQGPLGSINVYRNGIILKEGICTYDSATSKLTYNAAANDSDDLVAGDDIIITYAYSSGVGGDTRLGDLIDVDANLLNAKHRQSIYWDSDANLWKPTTFYATYMANETVTLTQVMVDSNFIPMSNVVRGTPFVARNGIIIPDKAIVVNNRYLIYEPIYNQNDPLEVGDEITAFYQMTEETAAIYDRLNDMKDVTIGNADSDSVLVYSKKDKHWTAKPLVSEYKPAVDSDWAIKPTTIASALDILASRRNEPSPVVLTYGQFHMFDSDYNISIEVTTDPKIRLKHVVDGATWTFGEWRWEMESFTDTHNPDESSYPAREYHNTVESVASIPPTTVFNLIRELAGIYALKPTEVSNFTNSGAYNNGQKVDFEATLHSNVGRGWKIKIRNMRDNALLYVERLY